MSLYHVSTSGESVVCEATVKSCPRGQENHIETNSLKEARNFAEERNLAFSTTGMFNSINKKSPKKSFPNIRIENNINDSYPYPQANDLEKIDTVIEAINNGASSTTGIGESLMDENRTSTKEGARKRDGHYYAEAAGYIGFVDKTGGEGYDAGHYELNDLGRAYLDAEDDERVEILKAAIENMPAMQAYRNAGGGHEGKNAAIETMDDTSGETTAERRASTIQSWANKVDSFDFNEVIVNERKNSADNIQKAILNDKARREEHDRKKKEAEKKEAEKFGAQKVNEKVCSSCYTIKGPHLFTNNSSVCVDCE